jgi:hypothetical protein
MRKIKLNTGKYAMVDDGDYSALSKYKWQEKPDKTTSYAKGSVYLGGGRYNKIERTIGMHRFIMGLSFGDKREVHHKNHNGLDNRRCNLIVVSRSQNGHNLKKRAKGYSWHKRKKKYISCIRVESRLIHLGYFKTAQAAKNAYLKEKEKYVIL